MNKSQIEPKQKMMKNELSMTSGAPFRAILTFATPLVLGYILQQLYLIIDAVIVGRWIGVGALAAVGASSSIMFLIMGFCNGACAGIIRKTKRSEKIKRSVPPRKTKRSFFRFPTTQNTSDFSGAFCCLFFITFQTFKSNFTFSSPSSSNLVRSKLFSYMCTFPRFSVMFFSGRSICRAMR